MKALLAKMTVLDWIIFGLTILFLIFTFVFSKGWSAWAMCVVTGGAVWTVRSLIGEPKL
jgi:uncharacterized membrane protein YjjB (DUF3815 family)